MSLHQHRAQGLLFQPPYSPHLGRVCLGSIRNKNNWNNASKRFLGAFLIPEYLDSILAILLPGAE